CGERGVVERTEIGSTTCELVSDTTTPRDPFSPRKQVSSERRTSIKTTTPRDSFSPRKQVSSEQPISIKTTTPRDPFSPRKTV
ncbi:unnamed protein product, partial [Rotaria sp. Silwood1]